MHVNYKQYIDENVICFALQLQNVFFLLHIISMVFLNIYYKSLHIALIR